MIRVSKCSDRVFSSTLHDNHERQGVALASVSKAPHDTALILRLMQMKQGLVLQHVDGHRVDASDGVVICGCGDADQERDYASFLAAQLHPRMHRLQFNGGPLSIPPESTLHFRHDDTGEPIPSGIAHRLEIRDAVRIKQIRTVVLVAHVPCGAALAAKMPIDDVVYALMAAKREVIEHYQLEYGVRVACFLHVDWSKIWPGSGRDPRTYFVSREQAEAWLGRPPPPLPSDHPLQLVPTQQEFVPR